LDRLGRDPHFKQYFRYIDQMALCSAAGSGSGATELDLAAEQRLKRVSRDVQLRVKRQQDDKTAFRFVTLLL